MGKPLNIFEFSDYRKFIKSWLEQAKRQKICNLTQLAQTAQVHPTFLSQVLKGHKDLSLEQAHFITQRTQLTAIEKDYFFILIQIDRAGTKTLREYWTEKKRQIEKEKNKIGQRFEKHRELSIEQRSVFYSSWIYVAAWACTAIDGKQSLDQIANGLKITRSRAEEVLSFLVQTGICDESKGFYSIGEVHVHIPNESPFVVKHHLNWRMKAIQKMDSRESDELFFTAPLSLSKDDFLVIREKLNAFLKDFVDIGKESAADTLGCLNIDFFFPN
jgi:uncharacterized protein (TIGR02147 family)